MRILILTPLILVWIVAFYIYLTQPVQKIYVPITTIDHAIMYEGITSQIN